MPKFIIITKIPGHQGLINGVAEKYTVDETEASSADSLVDRVHIPRMDGGYCMIINKDDITFVMAERNNISKPPAKL